MTLVTELACCPGELSKNQKGGKDRQETARVERNLQDWRVWRHPRILSFYTRMSECFSMNTALLSIQYIGTMRLPKAGKRTCLGAVS